MQEVFEKIIEKLEELKQIENNRPDSCDVEGNGDGEQIYDDGRSQGRYEQTVRIIEIVKQEAAEYNNGWIPCSEPPKTSNYILLSFSNFSVPLVGRYEENEEGGAYYIGDEDETCASQDIFVNAWQPLPEPYQPKGE